MARPKKTDKEEKQAKAKPKKANKLDTLLELLIKEAESDVAAGRPKAEYLEELQAIAKL